MLYIPNSVVTPYTFSSHDFVVIRRCRGDHNRLGFAVQLCYLRFPGRLIALGDAPYPPILGMAAAQLKVPTGAWNFYAEREETRREHLGRGHLVRNPGRPAGGHQNDRNQPSSLRPVQTAAQRTLVAWGG